MTRALPGLLMAVLLAALGGCGFISDGDASPTKPNGFPLHGYVSVAGANEGPAGTPCQARSDVPDIVAGGRVLVATTKGENLATGALNAGVLATGPDGGYRCNFPFEVTGVPGGQESYVIVVGVRPAATFPAQDLRADKPAVIDVP